MKKYSIFSHTADIGIKGAGKNIASLFICMAKATSSLIRVPGDKGSLFSMKVKLSAADIETLLVAWLNEIIYLSYKNRVSFKDFRIRKICDEQIEADISGNKNTPGRFPAVEIKAATFHKLKVIRSKAGVKAQIILDL